MRIQPRQQLLEIWRAVAEASSAHREWAWGGRSGRNSISDAEQLLCVLAPAADIPIFKLDLPDETAEDVEGALTAFGDARDIPTKLVGVMRQYLERYRDREGAPIFSGGSYFSVRDDATTDPSPAQEALDVVDSYAVSMRVTLAILGFVKVFRSVLSRAELLDEVQIVEELAKRRLTAAMIGLLRGYAVYVFDSDSDEDQNLCRLVNQSGLPTRRARDLLLEELRDVRAGLRDVTLGIGELPDLDNPNKLFECGWSWGVTVDAPPVKVDAPDIPQPDGVAQAAPYLYFTVVALDCIPNLSSERTRLLGLLDDEQQRLAGALQIRWDLTQLYWSRIARFGTGRWPLEDMPWRTTDGTPSDYLSLLVCSIVVQDLTRRPSPESTARVGRVLNELAERARITRRSLPRDPNVALHHPGFPLDLLGTEAVEPDSEQLVWRLVDFSPQLLKQAIRVARLSQTVERRQPMIDLVDTIWNDHINKRRLTSVGLWDRPDAVYENIGKVDEAPSWYYTERVIGCLITAAELISSPPLRSSVLLDEATDLLAEADHIFDQELMRISADPGPSVRRVLDRARASLRRAHEVIDDKPGTASSLARQVLIDLDQLESARHSAVGIG
jgi:hypothetical protein